MTALLAALILATPVVKATTLDGKLVTLPVPAKVTVLLYVGPDCPIANRLLPELNRIVTDHKSVAFYFVYPDPDVTPGIAQKHRSDYLITAPAILDREFALTDLGKAKVTPEAAVFDKIGKLAYRGRINDLFSEHNVTSGKARKNDLRDTLATLQNGLTIKQPHIPAIGCPISRNE